MAWDKVPICCFAHSSRRGYYKERIIGDICLTFPTVFTTHGCRRERVFQMCIKCLERIIGDMCLEFPTVFIVGGWRLERGVANVQLALSAWIVYSLVHEPQHKKQKTIQTSQGCFWSSTLLPKRNFTIDVNQYCLTTKLCK